jgi:hypothetical protein
MLARRSHLRGVDGHGVVGADDGVNHADADGVAILFIAERDERPRALHQMRGYLPVILGPVP